jgi:Transposase
MTTMHTTDSTILMAAARSLAHSFGPPAMSSPLASRRFPSAWRAAPSTHWWSSPRPRPRRVHGHVSVMPTYRGRRRSPKPAPQEDAARAHALSQAFLGIVRERRGEDLEAWMAEAMHSGIAEVARFVLSLQGDLRAIKAGLTLEWSNGATEGQSHRLKLVKRQGYGRAGFALLRQRVLQAA